MSNKIEFTTDELKIIEKALGKIADKESILKTSVDTAFFKIGWALRRPWALQHKFTTIGWIRDLTNPFTTQQLMLQSVLLSLVDNEVYDCPVDILRHMNASTRRLAKELILSSKLPLVMAAIEHEAIQIDLAFDQSTMHIAHTKKYSFIRVASVGVSSKPVNLSNYGEQRSKLRLRFLRDRILRQIKNDNPLPELSHYLTCNATTAQSLLDILTESQLDRVMNPQSTIDRFFQDVLLHLVDPEVYFVTMDRVAKLPSEDIEALFDIITSIENPEIMGALAALPRYANNLSIAKYDYISETKTAYVVCITNEKDKIRKSFGFDKFGKQRGLMYACYIRDRLMYDVAKNGSPSIMIPLKGLKLRERTARKGMNLCLSYQWKPEGSKNQSAIDRSCAQGFMLAFHKLKLDLDAMGIKISPEILRSIRPSQDQYDRYHKEIFDLPGTFS